MRQPTVSRQLRQQFLQCIRCGRWSSQEPIPTEMELAEQFAASRTAVRRALKELEASGLLASVQGSGRRITERGRHWSATIGLLARGGEFSVGQARRFLRWFDDHTSRRGHSMLLHAVSPAQGDAGLALAQCGLNVDQLDAAILYSNQYHLAEIEQLAKRIPVVSTPNDATTVAIPSFVLDYGMHASMAVEALAAQGHRRIAMILSSDPRRTLLNTAVRRGYDLGRLHAALPLEEELILQYPRQSSPQVYQQLYESCLAQSPPVTAVISRVVTPLREMMAISRQRRDGWHRRTSLVCLADLSEDAPDDPVIADFSCEIERMVADAVACLDGMLRGNAPQRLSHVYYGTLRPQQTLRPPA